MPRAQKGASAAEVSKLTNAIAKLTVAAKGHGAYHMGPAYRGKGAYTPVRRQRGGVRGRGFYSGFGRDIGGVLGGLFGHKELGATLGSIGSKITGFGAYQVKHNVLADGVPMVMNPPKEGETTIRFREYIGDVYGSSDFNIQYTLPLNPGIVSSFPWLSAAANAYQQYRWDGLIWEFVSTSGDATGADTALGSVSFVTDYDSVDAPPPNLQHVLNQQYSTSGKPSCSMLHAVECARSQTSVPILYTRNTIPPANADVRLYDLGRTYVCTQGNQSDSSGNPVNLGQLWVTYQLAVLKPQLSAGSAADSGPGTFHMYGGFSAVGTDITGVIGSTVAVNSLQITPNYSGGNNLLLFPVGTIPGNYLVIYDFDGASTSGGAPTVTTFAVTSGLTVSTSWDGFSVVNQAAVQNGGTGGNDNVICFMVTVPEVTTTLQSVGTNLSSLPAGFSATALEVWVISMPVDVLQYVH